MYDILNLSQRSRKIALCRLWHCYHYHYHQREIMVQMVEPLKAAPSVVGSSFLVKAKPSIRKARQQQ